MPLTVWTCVWSWWKYFPRERRSTARGSPAWAGEGRQKEGRSGFLRATPNRFPGKTYLHTQDSAKSYLSALWHVCIEQMDNFFRAFLQKFQPIKMRSSALFRVLFFLIRQSLGLSCSCFSDPVHTRSSKMNNKKRKCFTHNLLVERWPESQVTFSLCCTLSCPLRGCNLPVRLLVLPLWAAWKIHQGLPLESVWIRQRALQWSLIWHFYHSAFSNANVMLIKHQITAEATF